MFICWNPVRMKNQILSRSRMHKLWVWFKVGDVTSMSLVDVALHYIMVMQIRCLCIDENSCMELCNLKCDELHCDWWFIMMWAKYEYVISWCTYDVCITCDVWIYPDCFVHRLLFERIITPFMCCCICAPLKYRQSGT